MCSPNINLRPFFYVLKWLYMKLEGVILHLLAKKFLLNKDNNLAKEIKVRLVSSFYIVKGQGHP